MTLLIIVGVIFLILAFPCIPFCLTHLHLIIWYGCKDIYNYFKYKRWNEFRDYGKILTWCGLFGTGKTLSLTHYLLSIYNHYNGKLVYDFDLHVWKEQKIHIVSNYHLEGVPYEPLTCEEQLIDFQQDSMDIRIFVLDEIGAIFNNRDYKNFTPDILTSMLQCRKKKALFLGTSQRFQMMDKNFRTTMEDANQCRKTWRIVRIDTYDAYQLENCSNPLMLNPIKTKYWFSCDSDYKAYDTSEMISKLSKDALDGRLLTSSEITDKIGCNGDIALATSRKRKFKKVH